MVSASDNFDAALTVFQVSLQKAGTISVPESVQTELNLAEGDTLNLVKVGDWLLMTPMPLRVPQLADQITTLREDSQLELADLLAGLTIERQRISAENTADA